MLQQRRRAPRRRAAGLPESQKQKSGPKDTALSGEERRRRVLKDNPDFYGREGLGKRLLFSTGRKETRPWNARMIRANMDSYDTERAAASVTVAFWKGQGRTVRLRAGAKSFRFGSPCGLASQPRGGFLRAAGRWGNSTSLC